MIEFGGVIYYIDIVAFDKAIAFPVGKPTDEIITKETTTKTDVNGAVSTEVREISQQRGKEIDAPKYDILKTMLEVLLDYEEDADTDLGAERALSTTPLSHKLAFNTLYKYGILKEAE